MDKSHVLYRTARSAYRLVRDDLIFGLALVPYGRARQRTLRSTVSRTDSHTYTSFYRSPAQLDGLTGPVISTLQQRGVKAPKLLVFAGSNGSEAYTIASELSFKRPTTTFEIVASDLHQEMVDKARSASYTREEITQALEVPETFFERTFDKVDDKYVVKKHIREMVRFEQADLFDPKLSERFEQADIVFAQNVLFHMPPEMAERAFHTVTRFLKPGSFLFLDGMEIDQRVELTRRAGLIPLDYRVREIYSYSRGHIPATWWRYYWGNEPYLAFAKHRLSRYGTIFEVPPTGVAGRS